MSLPAARPLGTRSREPTGGMHPRDVQQVRAARPLAGPLSRPAPRCIHPFSNRIIGRLVRKPFQCRDRRRRIFSPTEPQRLEAWTVRIANREAASPGRRAGHVSVAGCGADVSEELMRGGGAGPFSVPGTEPRVVDGAGRVHPRSEARRRSETGCGSSRDGRRARGSPRRRRGIR